MSSKNKKDPVRSRAEKLIEEAVRSIETREAAGESDEVVEHSSHRKNRTSGISKDTKESIAKIDLQQFVDKETYLRLAADFENFRKRALKERVESERVGREKVLRQFLEIFDNLERALQQAGDDSGPLASGLRMIFSQAESFLRTEGLERISTVGELFNPEMHEAVSQVEDSQKSSGMVLGELKRGYRWPDRLLRPASVMVCRNKDDSGPVYIGNKDATNDAKDE